MPEYKLLSDKDVQKIHKDAHKEYLEQGVFILSCLMQKSVYPASQNELIEELAQLYRLSQRFSFNIHDKYKALEKILNQPDPLPALRQFVAESCVQADMYKDILSHTIRKGMHIRQQKKPTYPTVFRDKTTLYYEVEPILTQKQILQKIENDFQAVLPPAQSLKVDLNDMTFIYQNQVMRAGRFLFQRCKNMSLFLHEMKEEPDYMADYVPFLQNADYEGFKKFRSEDINRKSQFFGLRNELDFYLLSSYYRSFQTKGQSDFEQISQAVKTVTETYKPLLKDFQFTADHYLERASSFDLKETEDITKFAIDLIMISNHPATIARKSTYVWWQNHIGTDGEMTETCMAADGENHSIYVPRSIGSGSLIAIGMNKYCPDRWLSRIDIEPYVNAQTKEVLYQPGRLYGQPSVGFYHYVKSFCNMINVGKEGTFKLKKGLYRDNGLPVFWEKFGKEERSYS